MKAKQLFKQLGLATLGLAVITKRNIEQMAKRLVKEGKLNKQEAKAWQNKILATLRAQSRQMAGKVFKTMEATLRKAGVAKKSDVEELKRQIVKLERELKNKPQ